jgi:predicted RNase H-like HicB family nuclease
MLMIATEREDDGRWIAEVPDLPGVLAYGATETEAIAAAREIAQHVIVDRAANGEQVPNCFPSP